MCFRNLQKRVDSAISLFGDKNAGGIVLLQSFKDYYYGYESIAVSYTHLDVYKRQVWK